MYEIMIDFLSHERAKISMPYECFVGHALEQAFPFLSDTLSQFVCIIWCKSAADQQPRLYLAIN